MDLSKILSISGKSGLFKVVSQLKNAVLVESLADKRRFPAFAHDKISSMEEIAVFTLSEDKPLKEILKAIYEKQEGKPTIDTKSGDKELKQFFLEMVPDYDQDRVYISDIRKIFSWYNILLENELLDFTEKTEEKDTQEDNSSEKVNEEGKSEKEVKEPKPKTAKKATAAKTPAKASTGTPRKRKTEE
jgi:hypothetical protein